MSSGYASGTPALFAHLSLLLTSPRMVPAPLSPAASYKRCHSSSRDEIGEEARLGEPKEKLNLIVLATRPMKNVSSATPIPTDILFITYSTGPPEEVLCRHQHVQDSKRRA